MEAATDREPNRVASTSTSAERYGILAVRVAALPFLVVAVALWGAIIAFSALAHGIAVVVDISIGAMPCLRRRRFPSASVAPDPVPSASHSRLIGPRSLRAKPR